MIGDWLSYSDMLKSYSPAFMFIETTKELRLKPSRSDHQFNNQPPLLTLSSQNLCSKCKLQEIFIRETLVGTVTKAGYSTGSRFALWLLVLFCLSLIFLFCLSHLYQNSSVTLQLAGRGWGGKEELISRNRSTSILQKLSHWDTFSPCCIDTCYYLLPQCWDLASVPFIKVYKLCSLKNLHVSLRSEQYNCVTLEFRSYPSLGTWYLLSLDCWGKWL